MDKKVEKLSDAFRNGMADGLVDKFMTLSRNEQKAILLKMLFVDQCHAKINETTHDENLDTEEMAMRVLHHIDVLATIYTSIDDLCRIDEKKVKKNGK